jgi:hypothetical protein
MFNLIQFIDISDNKPGMLIPLLSAPNTNLPYVQQMDEFMMVREIVPFIEYENYAILPADQPRTVNLGDNGIIAFRTFEDEIFCGDIQEVLFYISQHKEAISRHAILATQLNRIESANLAKSYAAWRLAAVEVFPLDEDQQKFWTDSEFQLFQKQKRIWNDIDPLDTEAPEVGGGGVYGTISEHSTEYLLRWLSNRVNFNAKDWTKVWHYVAARSPFDDRVAQIALGWLFYLRAEGQDLRQAKSLINALLHLWSLGSTLQGFGEFLCDSITSDYSLLFEFIRPRSLFSNLMTFLSKEGNMSDVVKISEFCIKELPKEEFIVSSLRRTRTSSVRRFP